VLFVLGCECVELGPYDFELLYGKYRWMSLRLPISNDYSPGIPRLAHVDECLWWWEGSAMDGGKGLAVGPRAGGILLSGMRRKGSSPPPLTHAAR
jgi:hypothetical protein